MGLEGYSGGPGRDRGGLFDACMYRPGYNVKFSTLLNMTETIITAIITALCTGGLTWLFTLRYTRKQAEADAMKSVQEVYQGLIEDMKNDRKELRTARIRKNDVTK